MNKEKALELLEWLYKELEGTSQEMKDARKLKEYTREARQEGKADALMRIIKKLKIE
jgi:hypothetical protein